MYEHLVLRVIAKLLIPFILIFALYVQFHGDYGPGGGFQAGVIFAAAFILYGMVFGLNRVRSVFPMEWVIRTAAAGLLLYAGTGVVTMLTGGKYLDYAKLAADPAHGHHYGILVVELGVGVAVAAVMIAIFLSFAYRGDKETG